MKKLVCDLHTHTLRSGHAYGEIFDLTKVASSKGIELLGISDHGPGIPGTCHPFYFWGANGRIPEKIDGVEVLISAELNVSENGELMYASPYMDGLPYLIVGIHALKDLYSDQGIDKNTENLINCMKHPRVRIISHPDDSRTPLDYEKLVKACKEYNVALEINGGTFRKGTRPGYLENYKKILELSMKYHSYIVINSDAHYPDYVGNFDLPYKFVLDNGFDEELILNNDSKKFKQFINYNGKNTNNF